ncbi:hypothetical protein ABFX02_14G034550 [Erythranthe guttata]
MVGARELAISWKGCWDFTPNAKSRFSEVAKLRSIGWIRIQGKIKTRMLSKNTNYAAYMVFSLERMDGLRSSKTVVGICELPFHPISSETIGGVNMNIRFTHNRFATSNRECCAWDMYFIEDLEPVYS